MWKHKLTYTVVTLALLSLLVLIYSSVQLLNLSCPQWTFETSNRATGYVHANKVVVEPWRGEHHVYGIFMIPYGNLNERLFRVSIQGAGRYCGKFTYVGDRADGVAAKPKHYLIKGFLNTRTAVWLISQGFEDQLRQPQNWMVGYKKMK